MEKPAICPECGSTEVRETTRALGIYGDVTAFVCGVCDWASDPRIGRPPADRSKNFTLRRLIQQGDNASDELADPGDEPPPAKGAAPDEFPPLPPNRDEGTRA